LFTGKFWADVAERAIKTIAQAGLGTFGAHIFVDGVSMRAALVTIGVAAVGSVLSSIASIPVGDPGTASLL
jgi:ABC-type phosphate/phosphonate transport system permease subunit